MVAVHKEENGCYGYKISFHFPLLFFGDLFIFSGKQKNKVIFTDSIFFMDIEIIDYIFLYIL